MIFKNKFILASASLSRYNVLKKNRLSFVKKIPKCNEEKLKKDMIRRLVHPKKISLELSRLKSQCVSKKIKNKLVVGSDTVICFKGRLLSKAKNIKQAKSKISLIAGNTHTLYSSASVFYNSKEIWNTTQKSKITIRSLSEEEINLYLKTAGPKVLTAVGCYQAELMGPNIIKEIKGDFYNVLGFPLFPFLDFLKKHKLKNHSST
ncbi:Maf family protein [Alphaproteobacteria bacterium]|nr:Maf family protein [Alphaproteobacteria bacterium]